VSDKLRRLLAEKPLTLTLSPSEGEREKQSAPLRFSCGVLLAERLAMILPLPFRRGEGRGEESTSTRKSIEVLWRLARCVVIFPLTTA